MSTYIDKQAELPIILLVDDEIANLSLLRHTLRQSECRLRIATNGYDALKSIRTEMPDLILLDVVMPGMDGFMLCQQLKTNESTSDIPIIFLSSGSMLEHKIRAFAVGGVDYIVKPFQVEEVIARVNTHLMLSSTLKQLENEVQERNCAQIELQGEVQRRRLSEASEKKQRQLIVALLDSAIVLTSTLDADEVFDRILANIDNVIEFDKCLVCLVNDSLKPVAQRGYATQDFQHIQNLASSIKITDADLASIADSPDVVINSDDDGRDFKYSELIDGTSTMRASITVENKIIGILLLGSQKIDHFQHDDIRVMEIFAQQVGVAIKNAKRHAQVRHIAVLEERNRIARELHDTISQNLWSIMIIADTLPKLWDKQEELFWENLDHLGIAAQTTLVEMRSLLLELQPQYLEETPLCKLIENLTRSVSNKLGIHIHFDCNIATDIKGNIKLTFYRVAQEALNNIARHANAETVDIKVYEIREQLELTIQDDGIGFDLHEIPPDHMGIRNMIQRAKDINADLKITSEENDGTEIKLSWRS